MKIAADLHLHSHYSDGSKSPKEIVWEAKSRGLEALGLTDHETVSGLSEFMHAAEVAGLDALPGIEITCRGDIHILGYGIDFLQTEKMENFFAHRRIEYERSVYIVLERYRAAGIMDVSIEEIRKVVGFKGLAGTMHVAAYRHLGLHVSQEQIKQEVSRDGGICRVTCDSDFYPTTQESIDFIRSVGGIAILAHPANTFLKSGTVYAKNPTTLYELLCKFKREGIAGIEVYHSKHNFMESAELLMLARKLNLLVTGGSDDHGRYKSHGIGNAGISHAEFLRLKEAL
ncbi:MAG TPA: PHP domain-containing protein [Patescibacteria group bacterium]